jgi:hypothetical protein
MNNIAETRTQTLNLSYALPTVLAINTFTLLALEQLGQVPSWVKSAVALVLSF